MNGKSIISNAYLEDIGDAIRQKKGTEDTYYPSQMGDAIRSIEGIVPSGTLAIDAEGTYDVTQYAEVVIDVPDHAITSLTVTEDGTYSVPQGVDGYNPVTVNTGVAELQDEINSAVETSGCDPLVEGIIALTGQANATTGASDTTLTDAVGRLIGGYKSGIDVTIEDVPFTNVIGLATYLFDKIGGENLTAYLAILTNAVTPNQHQQMAYMIFEKQTNDINAGGLRIVSSGGYYFGISTNLAKVTIGDIYTIYTL